LITGGGSGPYSSELPPRISCTSDSVCGSGNV